MENNERNILDENGIEQNVNNSQNVEKKKTIILVSVLLILVLAIGVCMGYLFSNINKETKVINETKQSNEIKQENETEEENKTSKKLDESKAWVYDSNYNKDKENKIIDNDYNFNKNVIVPYININSKDAEKANNEIKKLYEEVYSKFGTKETIDSSQTIYSAEYKYYENNNFLSVVLKITDAVVDGGVGTSKLHIYNFNLDTLNMATFEEMAKLSGFNSTSEVTSMINKWEKTQKDFANSNPDKVEGFLIGVVDGQYFIDSNKKLNFVYTFGAAGTYDETATVEPNKEIEDFYDIDSFTTNTNSTQNQTTSNSSQNQTASNSTQNQTTSNSTQNQTASNPTQNQTASNSTQNQTSSNSTQNQTSSNLNVTEETNYSVFSEFKERAYKNADFNTTSGEGTQFCDLLFDEQGKPIITMGDESEVYFHTRNIENIKSEVAAGTIYVTFDFDARTLSGDITTGTATISFSNVVESDTMNISVKVNNYGNIKEFNNIEVTLQDET